MDTEKQQQNNKEVEVSGHPICPGIAIGKMCVIKQQKPVVEPRKIDSKAAEAGYRAFEGARASIVSDLKELKRMAQKQEMKDILDAQIEIAQDPELDFQIHELTTSQHYSVDYAIYEAFRNFIELIESTQNTILVERTTDIEDIRDQLIRNIRKSNRNYTDATNSIIVADDLSASQLIRYADHDIIGLILDGSGETSHTSIIARSLEIPTVIGTQNASSILQTDQKAIVDGTNGVVISNPAEETVSLYRKKVEEERVEREKLEEVLTQPSKTSCGKSFRLCANVEFEAEISKVHKYKAEGIGLLRTESLYLTRGHFEDGETQEKFYNHFVSQNKNLPVTIRLFDAGGDKFGDADIEEDNPFLGWRGIRILLQESNLLRDQLKAILRVAGKHPGQVRILIPMVSGVEELLEVKQEVSAIQNHLADQGKPVDRDVQIGVMVEVPSVVMMAEEFAPHVDFFSVGTNDLTQYTLAVDRCNKMVAHLYRQTSPAVWRLINKTVEAANKYEIPVTVCGELASNPVAAACLLGLGIRDLSMAPAQIPKVKKCLISNSYDSMKLLAQDVLRAGRQQVVDELFSSWVNKTESGG